MALSGSNLSLKVRLLTKPGYADFFRIIKDAETEKRIRSEKFENLIIHLGIILFCKETKWMKTQCPKSKTHKYPCK